VQPLPKLGPWSADLERLLEANDRKARRERLGSKPSRRRAPKRWPPGRSAAPATRQG